MDNNSIELLKAEAYEICDLHNIALLLFYHNDLGGITEYEIDYETARCLNIGENYMMYSINKEVPAKKNLCIMYKIVDKIIDEKNNIILFADGGKIIGLPRYCNE